MELPETQDEWKKYFLESSTVKCETVNKNNELNLYKTYKIDNCIEHNFLIVCVHGCGSSAMSWASTAVLLSKFALVAAIDLRCHGNSFKTTEDCMYLTVDLLVRDLRASINYLLEELETIGKRPKIVLLGHSIGSALAIRLVPYYSHVLSLVLIDYSEESIKKNNYFDAISAVNRIPEEFKTVEEAIEWSVKTSYISSIDSAKVSIPSQLIRSSGVYVWKCHPKNTIKHWEGWISGTNEVFLSLKTMKILIMRDIESLSTLLLSAHMQGNFQLKIIHGTTHSIHEDEPENIVEIIKNTIDRHVKTQETLAKITQTSTINH